jgi:hypothetical protein
MSRNCTGISCTARVSLSITAALFMLGVAAPVLATTNTYFGADDPRGTLTNSIAAHDDFIAALSSYGTDNLEAFAHETNFPALVFTGTSVVTTGSSGTVFGFPPLAVSGNNALFDFGPGTEDGPAIDDVFTFNQPVTAFGSYFSNTGDRPNGSIVTYKLENVGLGTSTMVSTPLIGPNASFTNVFFFGVTDTQPFDRVTVIQSDDFDGMLLDDLTVGFAVPEPTGLALATLTGLGLAWTARRRGPRVV